MSIAAELERAPRDFHGAKRGRQVAPRGPSRPAVVARQPPATPAATSSDRDDELAPLLARAVIARQEAPPADTDELGAAGLPDDDIVLTLEELEAEVGALDAAGAPLAGEAEDVATGELRLGMVPSPAGPVVQRVRKRKAPQRYDPSAWTAQKKITKRKTKTVKGGSTGGAPLVRPATAITWTAFLKARRKGTAHAGASTPTPPAST